jgi:hypothetical protein
LIIGNLLFHSEGYFLHAVPTDGRWLRSKKRTAAIMSLIQSARLSGHDPYASYLKGVLTRLPMQRASEIDQLLPHRWQPV